MFPQEQWIWLDEQLYPDMQKTVINGFQPDDGSFAVAEFTRRYEFKKPVTQAMLRFSGDTEFRLVCNGTLVATGPATIAGDFMCNDEVRPWHYATQVTIPVDGKSLDFYVRVKLKPCGINEYSRGHGGWMLGGIVAFADGSAEQISTDETWQCRQDTRFAAPDFFDGSRHLPSFSAAKCIGNIWHSSTAPLRPRTEETVEERQFQIAPQSKQYFDFDFDRIYAGFVELTANPSSRLKLSIRCLETTEENACEKVLLTEDTHYVGLQLHNIGRYQVEAENEGTEAATVVLSVRTTHYPADQCAHTVTSDGELNAVLRQCEHALKHCRQMIHLDSPLHSEPLACTGDYYIESLMTAFSYGDLSLAEFDIVRTGEMLRYQKGVMFHTTYSLIWVLWLYDVYLYTGNVRLLEKCVDALHILMDRMRSYKGENGLIETPPSFMFIDWLYLDGISLHHPPKALGQTCLNLFYAAALTKGAEICGILGDNRAQQYTEEAVELNKAINAQLFDSERGLYFEGLNTPTPDGLIAQYMPANTQKRYFRKHANILAVYAGVYEGDAAAFLSSVLEDESLGDYQPYFAHFVLEAVNRTGLAERYLLPLCERWKQAWRECPKGLQEGFIKPEPTYQFDHSHAWGGTPLYAVPLALSGLKILEPGMKKIVLRPQLMGLKHACVEIPTQYGMIRLEMENGREPLITAPPEINIVIQKT